MLTELRRYAIEPGDMDRMHERMTDLLFPLFREHGLPTPSGIWENRDETSTFTWIVSWPDFETRARTWLRVAPAFAAARLAEGTPEFVTRTTITLLSPLQDAVLGFDDAGACELLWQVHPRVGFGAAFAGALTGEIGAALRGVGATSVKGANLMFGALPQAAVFVGWASPDARTKGLAALRQLPLRDPLDGALIGDGVTIGLAGAWETLDRAPYLSI
ncbi:hypothetical protein BH10PSE3_BH10PSE3_01600 [soil metagenome]